MNHIKYVIKVVVGNESREPFYYALTNDFGEFEFFHEEEKAHQYNSKGMALDIADNIRSRLKDDNYPYDSVDVIPVKCKIKITATNVLI